jgi:7,8-dihydroneopterin aldolase/epimerase/oxygenase
VTSVRITLKGIQAEGRHGANPGERRTLQAFVVDLDVVVDVDEDALDATADYRALTDAARQTVAQGSFELLETLADAVARAVYAHGPVRRVVAVVHKPGAAASMGIDDVSVEAIVG